MFQRNVLYSPSRWMNLLRKMLNWYKGKIFRYIGHFEVICQSCLKRTRRQDRTTLKIITPTGLGKSYPFFWRLTAVIGLTTSEHAGWTNILITELNVGNFKQFHVTLSYLPQSTIKDCTQQFQQSLHFSMHVWKICFGIACNYQSLFSCISIMSCNHFPFG